MSKQPGIDQDELGARAKQQRGGFRIDSPHKASLRAKMDAQTAPAAKEAKPERKRRYTKEQLLGATATRFEARKSSLKPGQRRVAEAARNTIISDAAASYDGFNANAAPEHEISPAAILGGGTTDSILDGQIAEELPSNAKRAEMQMAKAGKRAEGDAKKTGRKVGIPVAETAMAMLHDHDEKPSSSSEAKSVSYSYDEGDSTVAKSDDAYMTGRAYSAPDTGHIDTSPFDYGQREIARRLRDNDWQEPDRLDEPFVADDLKKPIDSAHTKKIMMAKGGAPGAEAPNASLITNRTPVDLKDLAKLRYENLLKSAKPLTVAAAAADSAPSNKLDLDGNALPDGVTLDRANNATRFDLKALSLGRPPKAAQEAAVKPDEVNAQKPAEQKPEAVAEAAAKKPAEITEETANPPETAHRGRGYRALRDHENGSRERGLKRALARANAARAKADGGGKEEFKDLPKVNEAPGIVPGEEGTRGPEVSLSRPSFAANHSRIPAKPAPAPA